MTNAAWIWLDPECNFWKRKCYTFRPVIVGNYCHGIHPTRNPRECDVRDTKSVSKCSFGYLTRLPTKLQIWLREQRTEMENTETILDTRNNIFYRGHKNVYFKNSKLILKNLSCLGKWKMKTDKKWMKSNFLLYLLWSFREKCVTYQV